MKLFALATFALAAKGSVKKSNHTEILFQLSSDPKWDRVAKRGGKHGRLHVDNPGQDRLLLHYPICMTNRESPLCDKTCVKERVRNVFLTFLSISWTHAFEPIMNRTSTRSQVASKSKTMNPSAHACGQSMFRRHTQSVSNLSMISTSSIINVAVSIVSTFSVVVWMATPNDRVVSVARSQTGTSLLMGQR